MQREIFSESIGLNILPFQGKVEFYPDLFSPTESILYLELLKNDISWKQEPIKIMGKEIMQPRLTAWYGDPGKSYRYSGIKMNPLSWNSFLLEIKERIENRAGVQFNSVLLNFYRTGQDSMGWHRDNEKELGPEPIIGSISFGATRTFQFRPYKEKKPRLDIPLGSGSGLVMRGETNHFWEHRIPKSPKLLTPRINLTFRRII